MFIFVKKEIIKKSKKDKNKIYFNLAPTGDAQEIESYRDALEYALDEKMKKAVILLLLANMDLEKVV